MNNLKKFATEADYSAATLNYPAVSWVVSGDTVHYDKAAPVVNDKFMMAFTASETSTGDIVLWNVGATDYWGSLSSCTINDVDVSTISGEEVEYTYALEGYSVVSGQSYVVKYGIIDGSDTFVSECLTGDLGGGWGSGSGYIDFLVPSQVTTIDNLPNNAGCLVIEATTPPTTSLNQSEFSHIVYVPDSALTTYQNDATWSDWGEMLKPISEYSGNLPV